MSKTAVRFLFHVYRGYKNFKLEFFKPKIMKNVTYCIIFLPVVISGTEIALGTSGVA